MVYDSTKEGNFAHQYNLYDCVTCAYDAALYQTSNGWWSRACKHRVVGFRISTDHPGGLIEGE